MKILIDGDSCNVIPCTERIASTKNIMCHIYCDVKHFMKSDYSEIHVTDSRKDAADFAILNKCNKNDIVITNDSGLAAMVLSKRAYVINSHGFEYTKHNIDAYLNSRYLRSFAARKTNKQQIKGIMKPTQTKHTYAQVLYAVIKKSKRNETNE